MIFSVMSLFDETKWNKLFLQNYFTDVTRKKSSLHFDVGRNLPRKDQLWSRTMSIKSWFYNVNLITRFPLKMPYLINELLPTTLIKQLGCYPESISYIKASTHNFILKTRLLSVSNHVVSGHIYLASDWLELCSTESVFTVVKIVTSI